MTGKMLLEVSSSERIFTLLGLLFAARLSLWFVCHTLVLH
jgi:hypothetical protein